MNARERETEIRTELRIMHREPTEPATADRIGGWLAATCRILGNRNEPADPTVTSAVANLATCRRFDRLEDEGVDTIAEDGGMSFLLINHAGTRFRVTVTRED